MLKKEKLNNEWKSKCKGRKLALVEFLTLTEEIQLTLGLMVVAIHRLVDLVEHRPVLADLELLEQHGLLLAAVVVLDRPDEKRNDHQISVNSKMFQIYEKCQTQLLH